MALLLNPRVWLALGLAALLAFVLAFTYRAGKASVRADWQAETIQRQESARQAEQENRRIESARQSKVIEATNAATKRNQVLQASAADARAELGSLRRDLDTISADLPSASADACRRYAAAANSVLRNLAESGAGIAAKADEHSSDSLMLQDAWPK
jgi:uncharacterized iron-regulated membrane protein